MNTPIVNAIISRSSDNSKQYKQIVLLGSRKFIEQVNEPNTKYIVKYNFDLKGQTVVLPENCILAIDGGQIKNGTIVVNGATLLNVNKADNIFDNVNIQGMWGQNPFFEDNTDNLSLIYFDKNSRKLLWWDGEKFIELMTV